MERFHPLLLDVWREACQHIEIGESAGTIAAILGEQLPLACLLVRRFDRPQQMVQTVAIGSTRQETISTTMTSPCSAANWKRLLTWAERGRMVRASAQQRSGEVATLVPPEIRSEIITGPLRGPDGAAGALVLVADNGQSFHDEHAELLTALLEPFSAALENDRRLHELQALREAAEADRRSLLSRLGRQEVNEEVVGSQTGLRHVMERVELVSQSDVPVLILGETGTGKEVVSRAIHTRSKRASNPFIRVNCGAIPPELIDSQLFGHEKGSFTGAAEQHQGWFERADGGTLFLDEIGELPLAAQVRLLRVLQDHQIERVGGKQPIRVDVRIVAATHRDLASMVKTRQFREDLFYRVNVFPILLPRLRERIEDIPALARHFAQRAATRFGLPFVSPTAADLRQLATYSWPGNIRELGAVIDRAAILGNGHSLEVAKALGLSQPLPPPPPSNEPVFYEVIPETTQPLVTRQPASTTLLTLDEAMKQHIEQALTTTRGRIEGKNGTAALLGINPHTLRARMKKLGIDWNKYR